MALSKADLDGYVAVAITYLLAEDYKNARLQATAAGLVLEALPATDRLSWRSGYDSMIKMIDAAEGADADTLKYTVLHAGFRNRRRSTN